MTSEKEIFPNTRASWHYSIPLRDLAGSRDSSREGGREQKEDKGEREVEGSLEKKRG